MRNGNFDRMLRHHRDIFRLFASDVFGQLQQDGTWPLFHGDAEGVANDCRDTACAHDLE